MPTIELNAIELMRLQSDLRRAGIDDPGPAPSKNLWFLDKVYGAVEGRLEDDIDFHDESYADHYHRVGFEEYPHDVAGQNALHTILAACPICGKVECNDSVAYIDHMPIHASQHPENKAERAMGNPRAY